MKAVATYAVFAPVGKWQGVRISPGRHVGVEGRVEDRDLGGVRQYPHGLTDPHQDGRIVQGSQWHTLLDLVDDV